ncbi:CUB domain-containing protein 1-like [Polymixia lowei]
MLLSSVRCVLEGFLLTFAVLNVSGVQKMTISPDRGTTFNISSSQVKGSVCTVCTGEGRSQECGTSVLLRDTGVVSVEFKCSKPQDLISVEILRNIECNTKSCNGEIIQTDSGSLPLMDFNRTFTWNLKASTPKAFQIDFSKMGLKQINPSENCPDKHTYTLQASQATGEVDLGTYCRSGTVSGIQVLSQGRFSLDVPAKQKLQAARFLLSVGEEIKSLAKVKLILPKGSSSSELLSPNYPHSFPDDDLIEWEFQVPAQHNAAVQVLNYMLPRCKKKETAIEYHSRGRGALVLRLSDTQPAQKQGNFSLTLRNCEMDRSRANSPGLSLRFKVSADRTSFPVLCNVDLRKEKGLSLYIEKIRPGSDCELKMNSVSQEKITVQSHRVTPLSFLDCSPEDVLVIARRTVECHQLRDCPNESVTLAVPDLPRCLPAPLSSVTWTLRPPPHGTVELLSPTGALRQSLPGQLCNDSITLKVAEGDGTSLGQFCPQGAIQKIQIHTNVSVTATGRGNKGLQPSSQTLLRASFRKEISDSYIFTVSPKKGVPVLLATPSWPGGMKSYSTVSWIVSVPSKKVAHLKFVDANQPKCSQGHTSIRVQSLGSLEEMYSRREDEEADREITASESFYLNMSTCMPERGHFSMMTQITLHNDKTMLTIIVSVVAALLVVVVIVLVVVCVVIRRKKKKINHEVSIYNPNGTSFQPELNGFPKSREDNESHIYASIEDTLVYTHLLRQGVEMGVYGDVDTYRSFTGPTDHPHKPPLSIGERPEVGVYQPFVPPSHRPPSVPDRPPSRAQPTVDNELYSTEVQDEAERSPDPTGSTALGLRMEPEGGD